MTLARLVLRSLWFYRRTHLGTLAGTAAAVAVLVGALAVGDSMRFSLERSAQRRLGRTSFALDAGPRTVRAALADDVGADLGADAAAVFRTAASASAQGGEKNAGRVQVLGVDARFWALGPAPDPLAGLGPGQGCVNAALAAALGLARGDELVVRVPRAGWLAGDIPFAEPLRRVEAIRLTVHDIIPDEAFGGFDLRVNQVGPLTVFLPRESLASRLGLGGRANVVLLAGRNGRALDAAGVRAALGRCWRASDAGLSLRPAAGGSALELVSDGVFLAGPVEKAARKAAAGCPATPVLTYLVNRLESGAGQTPYSFVSAPGAPLVGPDVQDDEILVNEWLARDLGLAPGSPLRLRYWVLGPARTLEERSTDFRVRAVLPLQGPAADRGLAPRIPGVSDAGSCRDWDPGVPIDTGRIRPQDEAYWNDWRGTPKAFVTLAAARRMWGNDFGAATAVRFPGRGSGEAGALEAALRRALPPEEAGLAFRPVAEESARSAAEAVDFAGLFAGFSFTLLVSALLLAGLLFALGCEERSQETGILRAAGFPPGAVLRFRLGEGLGLALAGGLAGLPLGLLYAQGALWMLGTVWRGATGAMAMSLAVQPLGVAVGYALGAAAALAAMVLAVRKQARRPVAALLAGERPDGAVCPGRRRERGLVLLALALFGGVALLAALVPPGRGREAAGAFWGAGGLALAAGLLLSRVVLDRLARRHGDAAPNLAKLGRRNAARRRGRSLAAVCLLALGVWVVLAVGANRHAAAPAADARSAGTGGFAFYGETALGFPFDTGSPLARRQLGLDPNDRTVSLVPARVLEGDDASCQNLNRVRKPRVLGLDPAELERRKAFSFTRGQSGRAGAPSWAWLDLDLPDGEIPAVADERVIVWGLGLRVGDAVTVADERGRPLRLRLVAGLADSVFQGSLVVSIQNFSRHFPSVGGARVLLVDAPPAGRTALADRLNRALRDFGLELTPAGDRLEAFQVVENTYLSIFLALGGLGLVMGTAGLGVVLLRNALERRSEFAVLAALGFPLRAVRAALLAENALLLALGLLVGTVSAAVSTLPALLAPGGETPWLFSGALLLLIAANGLAWTLLAARWATRGPLLAALRRE